MKKLSVIFAIAIIVTSVGFVINSKSMINKDNNNTLLNYKKLIEKESSSSSNKEVNINAKQAKAYFAGGCFWCIEGIFDGTPGVIEAMSGYIGGNSSTANYSSVGSGNTKHREGVEVIYNPDKVSFGELVEIFWRQIDPTDDGGQFADRGFQYTTAIYYSNDDELQIIEKSRKNIIDSKKFNEKIATKILEVSKFYKAEEHHQNYAEKQSIKYKLYKKGSGRTDYIKNTWGDDKDKKQETLKEKLTPLQYKVTQLDGTEKPFDNKYWDNKKEGIYVDIVDGTPLYSSLDKYVSGTGWPSFTKPIDNKNIELSEDNTLFSTRTEVSSKSTGNHLGHIFPDGPSDKGGIRHCLNSASLKFIPTEQLEEKGYSEYLELFN